jgi:hypothetical protein
MTSWQCTNLDDGHRCPYDAYYHGRCYQHRRDAPNPETTYPRPRHHCTGCGDPEPPHQATIIAFPKPPPRQLERYGRVRNDR